MFFVKAIVSIVLVSGPLLAGVTVLSDGTFNNGDWSATTVSQTGGASASATQVAAGGNPGSFRQSTLVYPALSAGGASSVNLASIGVLLTIDPSVSGAITMLEFSYDIMNIGGTGTSAFYRPYLRQGGIIYSLFTGGGAVNDPATSAGWTNFQHTSTLSSEWTDATGAPGSPDFSAAGGVIEFGYRAALNLSCPSGCGANTLRSGLDNYSVRVTTADTGVPEPAAGWLVGVGLCVMAGSCFKLKVPANRGA